MTFDAEIAGAIRQGIIRPTVTGVSAVRPFISATRRHCPSGTAIPFQVPFQYRALYPAETGRSAATTAICFPFLSRIRILQTPSSGAVTVITAALPGSTSPPEMSIRISGVSARAVLKQGTAISTAAISARIRSRLIGDLPSRCRSAQYSSFSIRISRS